VAQATAFIVASDNANSNIVDGNTFTLSDGVNSVIFEFDKDATPPASGRVRIDVSTNNLTPGQVRDKIAAAIDSTRTLIPLLTEGLHIDTIKIGADALFVTQDRFSSIGNTTIGRAFPNNSAMFMSAAFTGGAAGDCAIGMPCKDSEDCLAVDGTGFGTCIGTTGNKTCQ
jgi:hypothetical protein